MDTDMLDGHVKLGKFLDLSKGLSLCVKQESCDRINEIMHVTA